MRDSDYGKEYQLTLTPQETFKVKAKHGNDYEKLVKYLKLEREKLILMVTKCSYRLIYRITTHFQLGIRLIWQT